MNPRLEAQAHENGECNCLSGVYNGIVTEETEDKFKGMSLIKQGCYAELPAAKILELMKLKNIENSSTHSLFSAANKVLDDSIEKKNGDIPHCMACLSKKVVQEIEQGVSTQAQSFKEQKDMHKFFEERSQSRIRVLETVSTGTSEEKEVFLNQLQQLKIEKTETEEKKKVEEQDIMRLINEKDQKDIQISALKKELELAKKTYEKHCSHLEMKAKEAKLELEKKLSEHERLLTESRDKARELEVFSESNLLHWKNRELNYKSLLESQFGYLQELRLTSESVKREILTSQRVYSEEFNHLGVKLKGLVYAATNYHTVLAENRKLYNEVQDLKGKIRVYCRIRPFLPGQSQKQTTLEFIGENGELVVSNPLKQGKNSHRVFKFNKVFGPTATQEDIFSDTQPLVRSVLDGYNVCIFAYGQTGSGKTYTMAGPNISSKRDWGVNYRALSELFYISQSRKNSITYDVSVQMVEIYNEQVRDLLSGNTSQKRLGIWTTAQPNGLAVPDASIHPVASTGDVLELMNFGLMNRAVSATALNDRSSRSHSVLTVHVHGMDLKTDSVSHGSLHLVDLAGSERVDHSEVTGDRLREAQYINKSLAALGDVIFALAKNSPHVPYRNSKLTQVLQSSLGGQAKNLMFVHLNPDVESYSETISTLKFAERVSSVELGAARNNKGGRGVRELKEQMASLKDLIVRKDEEIGRLRMVKSSVNGERHYVSSRRYGSSSPRRHSIETPRPSRAPSSKKNSGCADKAASYMVKSSVCSDKPTETGSQQSIDDFRHHKEFFLQSRHAVAESDNCSEDVESRVASVDGNQDITEDIDLLGFGDADAEERLSDISDSGLSMGTETDGSVCSIVEFTLFPETAKSPADSLERPYVPANVPRPQQKQAQKGSSRLPLTRGSRVSSSSNKPGLRSSSSVKPTRRWQ